MTTHCIGYGFIKVIAFNQNTEKAGNIARTPFTGASAFKQLGQFTKYGWSITPTCRWLATGKANLTLCHGKARHTIHQADDFVFFVPEIFSNRHCKISRLAPHQGRFIGCGDNQN